MDYVYLLIVDCASWEDIVVFVSKEEAIEASRQNPNARVELFYITTQGYRPTYDYYVNGVYCTHNA